MRVGIIISSDISMKNSNYRKYYMNIDGKMKTVADIRNHIRISNNIKDNIAKIILQVNGFCLKPSDNLVGLVRDEDIVNVILKGENDIETLTNGDKLPRHYDSSDSSNDSDSSDSNSDSSDDSDIRKSRKKFTTKSNKNVRSTNHNDKKKSEKSSDKNDNKNIDKNNNVIVSNIIDSTQVWHFLKKKQEELSKEQKTKKIPTSNQKQKKNNQCLLNEINNSDDKGNCANNSDTSENYLMNLDYVRSNTMNMINESIDTIVDEEKEEFSIEEVLADALNQKRRKLENDENSK